MSFSESFQKREVLTITELTQAIKGELESRFPFVRVKGEVSNFKEQSSGHLYFVLKDSQAQISAVFFRGHAQGLKQLPQNGDQILVQGELNVYPPRGNYQLIVRSVEYLGLGDLLLQFQALKEKLERRGWFDESLKKPLPTYPRNIGIVTSPTGAVVQDIITVLSRRQRGFHLIINPVKVQGFGAAQEIARAIEQFNQHRLAEVLIVCRGGGSLEDLWAFNEERVAEAIFKSEIPIISAVGHQTDVSIADFVADVRAPTPSAAAVIVMTAADEHERQLQQFKQQCDRSVSYVFQTWERQLHQISKQPILISPFAVIGLAFQRLDHLAEEIDKTIEYLLTFKRSKLDGVIKQFKLMDPLQLIQGYRDKLSRLAAHIKSVDPKNILEKGYSILFKEDGESVIFSIKDILAKSDIVALMGDGRVKIRVESVIRQEEIDGI